MDDKTKDRYKKESRRFDVLLKDDDGTEFDTYFRHTTMRAYLKGARIGLQRKGQFIKVRVKEVIETIANGTKVFINF